jgi:hypothetical protein
MYLLTNTKSNETKFICEKKTQRDEPLSNGEIYQGGENSHHKFESFIE